jgi:cytochrome P450
MSDGASFALRLLSALGLALVVWPVIRMVASRPFRNRLAAHPGLPRKILACLAAYALAAAALILGPLPWLVAASMGATVVAGFAWWRARPGYGRSRGLPPGSLAATSLAMVSDDRYLLDQAARYGPVFKVGRFGQAIVCVMGIERAAELLRRHGDDLVSGPLPFSRLIEGGFIRYMPKERHAHYRRLLARALAPELVEAGRPIFAATAQAVLQRAATAADARELDPAPHLWRFTTEAMLRLCLGLDAADPRLHRILELLPVIASAKLSKRRVRHVRAALDEVLGIVAQAAAQVRASPEAAEPSLLQRLARTAPPALADPTLLGNVVYMIETGGRDTADLLLWALKMLGDHPDWAARLAAGRPGLGRRIVAETLRLEQSEYIVRKTRRPIEIEGFTVPSGWLIRCCVRESHRDADSFAAPESFDPDRFERNEHDPRRYAPLGIGAHTCLGQGLVMALAPTFLDALGRGFDWQVVADGPRVFGTFHWMPSPNFRIALARRPEAAVGQARDAALGGD